MIIFGTNEQNKNAYRLKSYRLQVKHKRTAMKMWLTPFSVLCEGDMTLSRLLIFPRNGMQTIDAFSSISILVLQDL